MLLYKTFQDEENTAEVREADRRDMDRGRSCQNLDLALSLAVTRAFTTGVSLGLESFFGFHFCEWTRDILIGVGFDLKAVFAFLLRDEARGVLLTCFGDAFLFPACAAPSEGSPSLSDKMKSR